MSLATVLLVAAVSDPENVPVVKLESADPGDDLVVERNVLAIPLLALRTEQRPES